MHLQQRERRTVGKVNPHVSGRLARGWCPNLIEHKCRLERLERSCGLNQIITELEDYMRKAIRTLSTFLLAVGFATYGSMALAQDVPSDYQQVLKLVGRSGDYKANVLKVNIPRNDLHVTIADYPVPTPFGFGGWFALTKGDGADDVMMGDLVLLQEEVNPVMSALLEHGLEVTALHNHFFWAQPEVFFIHIHGHGKAVDLANQIKPALDLIGHAPSAPATGNAPASPPAKTALDAARIAKIVGHEGEQNGAVYKITVGRADLDVKEMGATINTRMGLNTWAAFEGTDEDAAVAGDVRCSKVKLGRLSRRCAGTDWKWWPSTTT